MDFFQALSSGVATTASSSASAAVTQSVVSHLGGGDAPAVGLGGLGGVDMAALAARGEALVNNSIGLGGVERTAYETEGTYSSSKVHLVEN